MAVYHEGNKIAGPAGEDLRQREYHAGRVSNDGETIMLATAPGTDQGVLKGHPNTNDTATLQHSEVSQVCIGAAVAAGGWLAPNGSGRYVPAAAGAFSRVQAINAGSADGQLVTALVGVGRTV